MRELLLDGPWGTIRVERDELGYPTIHARDLDEATWARGYLHALDRLVQIHLTLVAARGELMSVVGDKPFARTVDRAVRGLALTNDLDVQVARLAPATRHWFDQYCAGFDAGAKKRGVPTLLRLLRRPVEPMTPRNMLSVYRLVAFFGLTSMQQTAEMIVTELVAAGAPRAAFDTLLGDGAQGLDLDALRELRVPPASGLLTGTPLGGSNAFAVAGRASRSGGALLVGEFHMEIGRFPPVVYASHVVLPDGSYQQGLGIPGLCWNSCGRNQDVAFTCTYGHADNVDVIAERCRDGQILVGDTWHPLVRRVETVHVRGRKVPESWIFHDGSYGTVLGDASRDGVLPCMRWSGLSELANDADVARATLDVRTVAEAIAVYRRFRMLSTQQVFADVHGAVGEVHAGRTDVRPDGWSGAYPFPGWLLLDREPAADEERRPTPTTDAPFVVAANHRPPGERGRRWVTMPEPHDRVNRISSRLDESVSRGAPLDLDALVRISYDAFDGGAARLCAVWSDLLPDDEEARAMVSWAVVQPDRAYLGLFHALHVEVTRGLLERTLSRRQVTRILDELGALVMFQFHTDRVLALEEPSRLDREALRTLLVVAWPVAKASQARFDLPLERRFVDPLTQGALGPLLGLSGERIVFPGAPGAPFQTRSVRFEDQSLVFGPAFHYATDVSEPGGWYHVPGGASERRLGPGYGKGVDLWAEGRLLPLGPARGRAPRGT